jgi:hypothetical protein
MNTPFDRPDLLSVSCHNERSDFRPPRLNPAEVVALRDALNLNLIEPDNYPGHLIAIIDLGTHDDEYDGKAKPDVRSLCLAWELSGETDPEGKPPVIAEKFDVWVRDGAFQYGDKNKLRKLLEGWRGSAYAPGEAIDPMAVLGKSCMINVVHKTTRKGKTIHVLGGISKLPKGMAVPKRHFEPIAFHVSMGTPPGLNHLPFIFYKGTNSMTAVADVIAASKEATGQPIGEGGDTPYSERVKPELPKHVIPTEDDDPGF